MKRTVQGGLTYYNTRQDSIAGIDNFAAIKIASISHILKSVALRTSIRLRSMWNEMSIGPSTLLEVLIILPYGTAVHLDG